MPGLSLIWRPDSSGRIDPKRWEDAAPAPSCGPEYRTRTRIRNPGLLVASNDYGGYPLREFADDGITYLVEGDVFPPSGSVDGWCAALGSSFFAPGRSEDRFTDRLARTDGDFVVIAVRNETGEVALATDMLGRLPLYALRTADFVMVSRDISAVLRYAGVSRLDRRGVAEHLALGHGLGERTMFEGVRRLEPGTVLRFEPGRLAPRKESRTPLNYDEQHWNGRDLATNAEALVDLFREAATDRYRPKSVVSLSGGLDSRSVAAALRSDHDRVRAATYLDPDGRAEDDARIASRIADCLELEWELFRLPGHTGDDARDLREIKAGLNHLGMTYILRYFEALLDRFGPGLTYFTGDGAVPVLKPVGPSRRPKDVDDLLGLIVDRHCVMPPAMAESFAGVEKGTVAEGLRDRIASYPERDLVAQYVRFDCMDRSVRYHFEGEDRNRYFFWSTAPFNTLSLFRYGSRCPRSQRAYFQLYREFLRRLSPAVAEIRRPAFAEAITGAIADRRHIVFRWLEHMIARAPLVNALVDRVRKSPPETVTDRHPFVQDIRGFVDRAGEQVHQQMDLDRIEAAIAEQDLTERQVDQIRTVMAGALVAAGSSRSQTQSSPTSSTGQTLKQVK